jgi:hypothetical protein
MLASYWPPSDEVPADDVHVRTKGNQETGGPMEKQFCVIKVMTDGEVC